MNINEKFQELGVVPVVVIEDVKDALPLAKALVEGGLPCAEVTFRTEAAAEAIRQILGGLAAHVGNAQCEQERIQRVDYCLAREIPVLPGCATPSEVAQAVKRGMEVVKFFPAEQAGGLPMIKAMAAPYHQLRFMPTGGINPENLKDYLAFDKILCCGGSWMVKGNLLKEGKFDEVCKLTKEAKAIADAVRK